MNFILAVLFIAIPLTVLIVAAVVTDRINSRTGSQPFEFTYRAYGA